MLQVSFCDSWPVIVVPMISTFVYATIDCVFMLVIIHTCSYHGRNATASSPGQLPATWPVLWCELWGPSQYQQVFLAPAQLSDISASRFQNATVCVCVRALRFSSHLDTHADSCVRSLQCLPEFHAYGVYMGCYMQQKQHARDCSMPARPYNADVWMSLKMELPDAAEALLLHDHLLPVYSPHIPGEHNFGKQPERLKVGDVLLL